MFCPKCKNLLIVKKDGSKKILACSCGYKSKIEEKPVIKEKIKSDGKEMEIIDEEQALETLPKTDAECPKCHHRMAYFWLKQTRAADEPETKFLKCEKCKHVWRDYS